MRAAHYIQRTKQSISSYILQTHRAVQVVLLHSNVLADTSEDDVCGCTRLVCDSDLIVLFVLVILQSYSTAIDGTD